MYSLFLFPNDLMGIFFGGNKVILRPPTHNWTHSGIFQPFCRIVGKIRNNCRTIPLVCEVYSFLQEKLDLPGDFICLPVCGEKKGHISMLSLFQVAYVNDYKNSLFPSAAAGTIPAYAGTSPANAGLGKCRIRDPYPMDNEGGPEWLGILLEALLFSICWRDRLLD